MSVGNSTLVLAVYVLAVARLTRLVNFDVVADPARVWVARRAAGTRSALIEAESAGHATMAAYLSRREGRWNTAAYLLGCPWCIGFWVGAASSWIPVTVIGWPWWASVAVALACSHLVGIGAPLADGGEDITIELSQPSEHG